MILIFTNPVNETKAEVISQVFEHAGLTAEQKQGGIFVGSVPQQPEELPGKRTALYVNTQTKEMWYEYHDRPLTLEEQLETVTAENAQLKALTTAQANRLKLMEEDSIAFQDFVMNEVLGGN